MVSGLTKTKSPSRGSLYSISLKLPARQLGENALLLGHVLEILADRGQNEVRASPTEWVDHHRLHDGDAGRGVVYDPGHGLWRIGYSHALRQVLDLLSTIAAFTHAIS